MTSAAECVWASIASYGGSDVVPHINQVEIYKIENQISRYPDNTGLEQLLLKWSQMINNMITKAGINVGVYWNMVTDLNNIAAKK